MTGVEALGAAVLHSSWQGALVAAACALAGRVPRWSSPGARHAAAWAGLAALPLAGVATWATLWQGSVASGSMLPGAGMPWARAVAIVWLMGTAWQGLRLVGGLSTLRVLRRQARPAPATCQAAVRDLASRLRVRRTVAVCVSSSVAGPLQIGWWHPVIVLPAAMLAGCPPAQLEALLAHELAHIRRRDHLARMLQAVLEAPFFYHPAAWWLGRQLDESREACCDDVVASTGADVMTYARALERAARRAASAWPAVAAAEGPVGRRIRRLLAQDAPRPGTGWTALLVPAATLAMIVWIPVMGQGDAHVATAPLAEPTPRAAQRALDEDAAPGVGQLLAPVVEAIEFDAEIAPGERMAVLSRAGLRVGMAFTADARHRLGRSLRATGRGFTFRDRPGRSGLGVRVVVDADC